MRLRFAFALWLAAASSSSEVEVAVRGDRVVVHAVAAPLVEVLTRFARATGAEVVYEAARPRQLVSIHIEGETAGEALTQLLEGQGVNYALRLDSGGRKVEMLVVTGTGGTEVASATPRGSRRPVPTPEPPPADENDGFLPDEAQPFAPDAVDGPPLPEPSGSAPADAVGGVAPAPWSGTPEGATGTQPPVGAPVDSSAPSRPEPPLPASYPGVPGRPVFPGPASYPATPED